MFDIKRLKKLNHYQRAAIFSLLVVFALCLYLLINGDLLLQEWFFELLIIPAFIGVSISAATYIARPLDAKAGLEKYLTFILIVVGLGLGIYCLLSIGKADIPFFSDLSFFSDFLLLGSFVSSFGGLGNRLAQSFSKNSTRTHLERRMMLIAAILGLCVSAVMYFAAHSALSSANLFVPGISLLLPSILGATAFMGMGSSTFASAGDYFIKAFRFAQYKLDYITDTTQKKLLEEHYHEYRGAFFGVLAALLCITIISCCCPHLGVGLAGIGVVSFMITFSISVLGGLFSRIGRIIDGLNHKTSPFNTEVPATRNINSKLTTNENCGNDYKDQKTSSSYSLIQNQVLAKTSKHESSSTVGALKNEEPSVQHIASLPNFSKTSEATKLNKFRGIGCAHANTKAAYHHDYVPQESQGNIRLFTQTL